MLGLVPIARSMHCCRPVGVVPSAIVASGAFLPLPFEARQSPPMLNRSFRRRALTVGFGLLTLWNAGLAQAEQCPPPPQIPTEAQAADAARAAQDRGFLWSVQRDGKTSYLYGTLHVGKLAWAMPGPRVAKALRASQVLAMELDVSDPRVQQQMAALVRSDGPSSLSAEAQAQLREAAKALCVDWDTLGPLRPEFQLTTLLMTLARYEDLDAGFGSEVALAAMAPHLGLPTRSLETGTEQVAALSAASSAELAEWVQTGVNDLRTDKARRQLRKLSRVWADSDIQRLERYPHWCECEGTAAERAVLDRVVKQRNVTLAERIDALIRQEGPAFVAVGALHMVGSHGLPALLKARGFTVKQVF